jgi:hypothetical protein
MAVAVLWALAVFVVLVVVGGLLGSVGTVEVAVAAAVAVLVGTAMWWRRRRAVPR